jgi:hypothetical protein
MYEEVAKLLRFSFLVYYVVSISFRVLFLENYDVFDSGVGSFFDYFVDLFYLVDVIISIPRRNTVHPDTSSAQLSVSKVIHRHTLVVPKQGTKMFVRRKDSITRTRMENLLLYLPHFVMLFPFEVVGLLTSMNAYYILRTTRLIRCCYFSTYWTGTAELLRKYRLAVSACAQRVILFTILLAGVAHVAACMFYNIAVNNLRRGIENNWLVHDGLAVLSADGASFTLLRSVTYRYVRAIYWSVQTLTTVGFGDVTGWSQSETWFCIFYFLVIALLVTLTLANLTMAITNYDAAHLENLKKINRFEKYAAYRHLPAALTNRVVSYYEHQWKRLRGMDELQVRLLHGLCRVLIVDTNRHLSCYCRSKASSPPGCGTRWSTTSSATSCSS